MPKKHGRMGKGGTDRGHGWALGLTPANVNALATNPPLSYPVSFKPKSIHLCFPPPFPYSPKPGSPSPMYHHCSALSQRHGSINPSQDLLFCPWSLLSNQKVISYIFRCEPSLQQLNHLSSPRKPFLKCTLAMLLLSLKALAS